ncbi:IPT/TIG domain-containing protein [Shewanella aegiceratis]|uniref:IPT/TIG domain-containing protein n=1 Tax=Shewanella aegiceratis TaxID=2864203 RepID=UPI001C6624FA|nr:IPT/TIG domain-containing protein [Shewanella aegiceratis]QYJ83054.1 IPT/TIG domain-containing protein [Shewanella aegiceratis]
MKHTSRLTKQHWLALMLTSTLAITGCNGELKEGEGPNSQVPTDPVDPVDPTNPTEPTEPTDPTDPTEPPQVGTWENRDEDGDGVVDELDDYPFDASKQSYPTTTESSFNDNPAVATLVPGSFPFTLKGAFEERGDGDVYRIKVDQAVIDADNPITFLLLMDDFSYKPTISILDETGRAIFEIKNNAEPIGMIGTLASVKFQTAGTYYVAIAEQDLAGDTNANYTLKAFVDTDYDGLPQDVERALEINDANPDTDGDGVYDANEVYVKAFGSLQLDVDNDGIPNWLDTDADNDGLPDSLELLADVDGDGMGAFVDTDSDGNTIADNVEAVELDKPLDTDHDGVYDFLDRDDDSDGLFDINDNDRLTKIALTEAFQVFAVRYQDSLGISLTDRSFPGERVFVQGQDIPVADATLVLINGSEIYNIKLTDFENDGFYFYLPESISDEQDFEYYLTDGNQRSLSKYFRVSSPLTPIIEELSAGQYQAGDKITIRGRNLQPSMSVHIGTLTVSPDSVVDNQAIITLPAETTSGFIYVESLQLLSNKVYLNLEASVTVTLNSQATATDLPALYAKDAYTNEFTALSDKGVQVVLIREAIGFIELYQHINGGFTPYTSLAVMSDEQTVEVNTGRLALSNILLMPSVNRIAAHDKGFLEQLKQDPNLNKIPNMSGLAKASTAIAIDLMNGYETQDQYINQKSKAQKAASNGSIKPTVTPGASYWDEISISPTRKAFQEEWYKALEYDGFMEVQNRSQLLLSLGVHPMNKDLEKGEGYVTDKTGKTHEHIQDMFDRDIIGAQYLQLFGVDLWSQDVTSKACPYTDCVYTVLSPGYSQPFATENDQVRIRSQLYLRSLVERGIWPSIKLMLDVAGLSGKVPQGPMTKLKRGKNIIEIILSHGFNDIDFIRDTIEKAQEDGQWSQAVEALIWGRIKLMLDTEKDALANGKSGPILTALLEEMSISPINIGEAVLKKIAVRVIPVIGEVAIVWDILKGVDSGADIAKFWWDLNKVGAQYDFYVNWGMKIITLNPGIVSAEDKGVELTIRGAGFKPIDNWWPWPDEHPLVVIYDQGNNDHKTEISKYQVNDSGTELIVTIPGEYLKDAKGDLRVEVEHREQITKSTDYSDPKTIKIGTGFALDKLYPDEGYPQDVLTLKGIGFDDKVEVWFTASSGQEKAVITQVKDNELKIIVPEHALTGSVSVKRESETLYTPFTLLENRMLVRFGDNGNLADDKYALWLDNKQAGLMTTGARMVDISSQLQPGNYTAELKGIEAPDDVGTYYICFSDNVTIEAGSHALSGRDLVRDATKSFKIKVAKSTNPKISNCAYINSATNKVRILQEE